LFGLILDHSGAWGWAFASLGMAALAGVAATPPLARPSARAR
jgi:hypothetical protein